MSAISINDYALLSDRHSAALVSRDGSLDWLCMPRFDSPSIFARLLGDEAGHWSIRATGQAQVTRRYLDRTMVLETTIATPRGSVVITDALAMGDGNRGHDLGRSVPHVLLRRATCVDGEVELELDYAPRPEYGLIHPLLDTVDGGLTAVGGSDVLVLSCPVPLTVDQSSASGRVHLHRGETAGFALHHSKRSGTGAARVWDQDEIAARLDDTVSAWESWSQLHQAYEGPWRDLVHHSGRVLQALSFAPTGAICAAATTSLPEVVGGTRNWDYRYAWVRDTSFTIEALWVAACPDEADQFFDYMTTSAAGSLQEGVDLQIMFGIGGEWDLTERELPHLEGWRGSAPVRVGNGAWKQRQLDVYGELLSAVYRVSDHLFDPAARRVGPMAGPQRWETPRELAPATRRFFIDLADAAVHRWAEKDQGIWEIRGEPRDFVYSKLMCWVALDRAVALAERLGASDRVETWTQTQHQIREAILTRGWSDQANAFTQSFDSDELDASNLMLPLVGFLPVDDPRVVSTIAAIEERLTDERGLVYRYRSHDGLEGHEGTFLLCTFWLAQALARIGQPSRARAVFERAAAFANDVGLLAEEVDPASGELLGNFPQAFSHIGLVNAAWAIAEAELREKGVTEHVPGVHPEVQPGNVTGATSTRVRHARHVTGIKPEAPMSVSETSSQPSTEVPAAPTIDMRLEVIVLPVSDVDRAKDFYVRLGWRLDADFPGDAGFRVVQVTPPGSPCSVIFGSHVTDAAPGSADALMLVVTDIETARADLLARGVDISDVFHDAGGVFHHAGTDDRVSGLDPQRRSYSSFASFNDPDGNGWILQEIVTRLPGR